MDVAVKEIEDLMTSQLSPELQDWKRRQQIAAIGGPLLTGLEQLQNWYVRFNRSFEIRNDLWKNGPQTSLLLVVAVGGVWLLLPQVYSDGPEPLPDQTPAGQTGRTGHQGHLRMRPSPPAEAPPGGAGQVPALPPHQEVGAGTRAAVFTHF